MAGKISENDIVGEVLDLYPQSAQYFLEIGMHCLGCPSARGETIAEACAVHGADCAKLIDRLNTAIAG